MRIVHFVQFGPRACGLYETAKDLILAERRLGVDAQLVDFNDNEQSRVGLMDGYIITAEPEIAYDADVLVRHSAIPVKFQNIGKPIIMCLHGRPESSYRTSVNNPKESITQAISNKSSDARYKAFVTFWPEYVTAWETLVGDKIRLVNAPVDLDYYSGGLDKNFSGSHKILIADIWRDDVIPLNSIFGAYRYCEKYEPTARIHIVGMPCSGPEYEAVKPILNGIGKYIGSASGHMKDIRNWYKSCDCLVTPHTIATRIIRESLTAAMPVVAANGCRFTRFTADHNNPDSIADAINIALKDNNAGLESRKTAEKEFDSLTSAQQLIDICRDTIGAPSKVKKVFLDIGGHLGESVRRFYRERSDADEFDIYSFEPDPSVFAKLFENIGMFSKVHCICAALTAGGEERPLIRGRTNEGEGSTFMPGKLTGDLGGSIPVRCIDIETWMKDVVGEADYIIVKMNVEGAEYELLPYLAGTGTMNSIDELYVQLHSLKFDTEHRIELDKIELNWRRDMTKFRTKIFTTTKGMSSFGNT